MYFVGIDGVDEIYAYGFRNPYRFGFDKLTGALIVPDVGQDFVEEINIVHKGRNYGWNIKEGDFLFDPDGVLVGLPALMLLFTLLVLPVLMSLFGGDVSRDDEPATEEVVAADVS